MGVIDRLAVSRAHVLVVPVPGYPVLRIRVEAAVLRRGWVLAAGPADADLLLTAGVPGAELAEAIDRVWDQVPRPRSRVAVPGAADIDEALGSAAAALLDRGAGRAAAPPAAQRSEGTEHEIAREMSGHDMGGVSGHDMGGMGGHDMSGHHMGGMSGHDMGGMGHMDMSGPAGIPLAGGDEGDRDGLEMDVLHLPLGPVLPDWPAGLVVDTTLRGDVVAEASARVLPGDGAEEEPAEPRVAALDDAARLLRLAGAGATAAALVRIRDDLLHGAAPAGARIAGIRRRVRRSLLLRWSLRSLDPTSGFDARARLLGLLDAALGDAEPETPWTLERLDRALTGRGLASARLLVAAAGVDTAAHPEAARD